MQPNATASGREHGNGRPRGAGGRHPAGPSVRGF